MNKRQKELAQLSLDAEKAVLDELEKEYKRALNDINKKVLQFSGMIEQLENAIDSTTDEAQKEILISQRQSKVYQKQYQEALQGQISGILDKMQGDEYATIEQYLKECYEDAYIGTLYDLQGQGIPLIMPIDQAAAVKAITTDSKISKSLYTALGVDVAKLKKTISSEITRGIASSRPYAEIARNLSKAAEIPKNRAKLIARTEGHRIQSASNYNACVDAKVKGADVVKKWSAALDARTRPSHRSLDGQIVEVEEPFKYGNKTAMFPGDFGDPAEDCNCRCRVNQRARWALDESELDRLKERAKYFELDKAKDFEDFKQKYLKAVENIETPVTIEDYNKIGTKMLSEAYEFHRINNNLRVVTYAEMVESNSYFMEANYGKLPKEVAQAFNDTLSGLISEYDTPLAKIRLMTKDEIFTHSSSLAFVRHNYSIDSAELVISYGRFRDFDKFKAKVVQHVEKGFYVKIPTELIDKYVPTHEFAHTLLNMQAPLSNKTNWVNADYGKIKKARKEINNVYEKYMAEVEQLTKIYKDAELDAILDPTPETWEKAQTTKKELDAVKISNYSLENADEFLAESFACEKLGVKSNPYSKLVLDILDKHFKR